MARKKRETKKQKLTLRGATQINKEIEFRGKIDRLVDYFQQEAPRLKNLKSSKLAILNSFYSGFKKVHDAYMISQDEKYKGKYKGLLLKLSEIYVPSNPNYVSLPKEQAKKIIEFPDDLLVSIFSSFLSPKWTPIKDPTDVLILLQVILAYTLYLEEFAPKPVTYQMNTATINLIWNALEILKDLDKKGWNSDRTTDGTKKRNIKTENKAKNAQTDYIRWINTIKEHRQELRPYLTRYGIAKTIKEEYKINFSPKKIVSIMEAYHKDNKTPPPWKKSE